MCLLLFDAATRTNCRVIFEMPGLGLSAGADGHASHYDPVMMEPSGVPFDSSYSVLSAMDTPASGMLQPNFEAHVSSLEWHSLLVVAPINVSSAQLSLGILVSKSRTSPSRDRRWDPPGSRAMLTDRRASFFGNARRGEHGKCRTRITGTAFVSNSSRVRNWYLAGAPALFCMFHVMYRVDML